MGGLKRLKLSDLPKNYDVIVIGSGSVGCGLYRDLSKHKISTLIVDQEDFCSQTSARSSKMLHGGIRYLETGDFLLVREALHEKKLWTEIAPHCTSEESFHIPVFNIKTSKYPLFILKIGLTAYDAFSTNNRKFS